MRNPRTCISSFRRLDSRKGPHLLPGYRAVIPTWSVGDRESPEPVVVSIVNSAPPSTVSAYTCPPSRTNCWRAFCSVRMSAVALMSLPVASSASSKLPEAAPFLNGPLAEQAPPLSSHRTYTPIVRFRLV